MTADLQQTRQAFYDRLGYVPEPDPKMCPPRDTSLDYYIRLSRQEARHGNQ